MKTRTEARRATANDNRLGRGRSLWRALGGAVLMAVMLYAALAAPGLLSDRDSTVPSRVREARQ